MLHCSGCHRDASSLPHGRLDSQPVSSNPGARALATGGSGFPGTDSSTLFAAELGQTMAQTWDYQRLLGEGMTPGRPLSLSVSYQDEWSGPGLEPDPGINDRDYDPNWTDIPVGKPIPSRW